MSDDDFKPPHKDGSNVTKFDPSKPAPRTARMGRPPHMPTAENRRIVESHAAVGTPQVQIARLLDIGLVTLKRYYRDELDLGLAKANASVARTLFQQATAGNVTAAIFWMKTRGGWQERVRVESTGADGGPVQVEQTLDVSRLSVEALREIREAAKDAAQSGGPDERRPGVGPTIPH